MDKSRILHITKLYIITLFGILSLAIMPTQTQAATASLYLSPKATTTQIKGIFNLSVNVNSGGNLVNAFEGTINIPTNILSIVGVGTGGSLCSLFVKQPTVSGSSVSFKCGVPNGTTANGTLITISVMGKAVGTGTATISGARILAGAGQNVTGEIVGGTYTILAQAESPLISSVTHPDQSAWYKNNNPIFTWSKSGVNRGYSYLFDQNYGTIPTQTINTSETSVVISEVGDGIWYLHLRANDNNVWSNTTHYRVQIDRTLPTNLVVMTDPKFETDHRPMLIFNAIDATSGIAYYEIQIDKGVFVKATSPYIPNSISAGDHTFTVRAYDRAGNYSEASTKIKIKEVQTPKITTPRNYQTFNLAQKLKIEGTASSGTVINIYLDGKIIAHGIKVGSDGRWGFDYRNFIIPGKHQIYAVAVRDGIESKPSDKINITIDPSAISIIGITLPSWIVFVILTLLVLILSLVVIWLFIWRKRKHKKDKDIR